MIPAFRKIRTREEDTRQLQDAVEKVLNSILPKQILDGRIIKNVLVTSGTPKNVDHGLGRELVGWFSILNSANSVVWDSQGSNTSRDKTLVLNASATTTISLWVF